MNDQMSGMQAIIHNISPIYMDNYMNAFTKTIYVGGICIIQCDAIRSEQFCDDDQIKKQTKSAGILQPCIFYHLKNSNFHN